MRFTFYQIAAPLLSIVAIVYAWNLVLRKKKSILEALLWTLFWGGISLIALAPWLLHYLSLLTGITDQVNAIFVTCIGILFFAVFYLVMRLEELEHRQAKMVRALGLREAGLGERTKDQESRAKKGSISKDG